jgi:integrase
MNDAHLTPKHGLTAKFLDNLTKPAKMYEISDRACIGLRIRVHPTGTKSFRWYYKNDNGKNKALTLGNYPATSIKQARIALDIVKEKHKLGGIVQPESGAPKTVKELADAFFLSPKIQARRRPDAVAQIIDHDITPKIGRMKLALVTEEMLNDLVEKKAIGEPAKGIKAAPSHAGKVLAIIKQLFGFAADKNYITVSPAAKTRRPDDLGVHTNIKKRSLDINVYREFDSSYTEIKAFWLALDTAPKLSKTVSTALKLLLILGVRSGELRLSEWSDVDFNKFILTIPIKNQKLLPKQLKSGTPTPWRVPLPPMAIDLLRALYKDGSVYVFEGKNISNGVKGPITDKVFGRAVRRLLDDSEGKKPLLDIEKFTPHDLRRTFHSHISQLGVSHEVAEKCLNHSLGRIDATYVQNDFLDQRREALALWDARLQDQLKHVDNAGVSE